MNGYWKIKSFAKINLALNIVGKSFLIHKIESIISFLSLSDEILIKEIDKKKHIIKFTGKFSKNIGKIIPNPLKIDSRRVRGGSWKAHGRPRGPKRKNDLKNTVRGPP